MKLLHLCLAAGILLPLATSCSQDAPWSKSGGDTGKISLKLKTDFSVASATRANDNESPVKPDGEDFAVRLEKTDGSYVKEWEKIGKFNDEDGFPRGDYTLTAFYGSLDEQGFGNPFYVGSQNISVKPGETATPSITAVLANSMVSIRYTDSFLNHFSSYSASVVSDGIPDPVVFGRSETRPAYVKPGEVTVNFSISSPEGQEVTVQPAEFTAVPRRHYIITANVNESGNNGVSSLEVLFEEDVVAETREILLTDELFSSTGPEITFVGRDFTPESTINTYESVDLGYKPEIHVSAFAGIKSAKLTVQQLSYEGSLPDFGVISEDKDSKVKSCVIDLPKAEENDQMLINNSGLKCYGLFKKEADNSTIGDKMAVIDFKEFIENLNPGQYRISLSVIDSFGRANQALSRTRAENGEIEEHPVSFNVYVNGISFTLSKDTVNPRFMSDQVSVIVTTNYEPVIDELTFETEASGTGETTGGQLESAEVISKEDLGLSEDGVHKYRFVLRSDNIDDTLWKVRATYPKKEPQLISIPIDVPGYKTEVDAFAKRIMIKITPDDPSDLPWMISKAKFYRTNGNSHTKVEYGITRDADSGIITIENVNGDTRFVPATYYTNYDVSYGNDWSGHHKTLTFTTEKELPVPNGDFEDLVETINATINQGGKWTQTKSFLGSKPTQYQTTLTMLVKEPIGWTSSNSLTCNLSAKNVNSWYVIPSVYNTTLSWISHQPEAKVGVTGQSAGDTTADIYKNLKSQSSTNAMVIRNVAWDLNGTNIAVNEQTGNLDFSNYFCSNKPSSIANRTAGFLYLGTSTEEGADFVSRPVKFKGQYKYITDNAVDPSEKGKIILSILSGDIVIATETVLLEKSDAYKAFEIPLNYISDIFNKKATKLRISIYSSNRQDGQIKTTDYCNKDECCSRGAALFIDALEFEY